MRFHTTVEEMTFDETADLWHLSIVGEGGARQITARYVINAVRALERPVYPDIDGIDRFKGTLLHPARRDDNTDLTDQPVPRTGPRRRAPQVLPDLAPPMPRHEARPVGAPWYSKCSPQCCSQR